MDMGGLAEMSMFFLCVVWAISAFLGILIGRLAHPPGVAFLCGGATAIAAGLVAGLLFFGITLGKTLC